jgi:hypothetical protein
MKQLNNIIIAESGKVFRRINDQFIMSESINLGVDFSTGAPREDKAEYYEEIDKPIEDETATI